MVELKSGSLGFPESKESSPKSLAFGLDSPVRQHFGGLSSPFANNSTITTIASGTNTFSNPSSGPPIMPASTMPAHNSSIARFGTPFSFPRSNSTSGTMSSDAMFCTCCAACNKPATSGGGSIFLHNDHFVHPPAFSFSTSNSMDNFRPPNSPIAGCRALAEPTAMHNVFSFPNSTSTCFISQPSPSWNSSLKSSTAGDGEKISNSASPLGLETSSWGKTIVSDYTLTPAPEDRINEESFFRCTSVSAMPPNKDRSHEELRRECHESKESKQESSSEGFAPFAAISNPFATITANKPSISSSFIAPFSQPLWFTPSAVKLAFQFSSDSSGGPSSSAASNVTNPNTGDSSICHRNASTQPPAFSFPTTITTASHFGPPRNSAPGGGSTNVPTDFGTKGPGGGFLTPTTFGPLSMTARENSTVLHFPNNPSSPQNTPPSQFPFESKIEGHGRNMRPTLTICSRCRQIEASIDAPTQASTDYPNAKSTSVSAMPDNNHTSSEELRGQCHKSKEKVGEKVDPVSEIALHNPHSFFPVMMLLPIPALTHSFGAFPWNTISGPCTGLYNPTLLGRNVPVLLTPSNLMGLNCFPTTASGGNCFPSFNIQAMPATTDSLSKMFHHL